MEITISGNGDREHTLEVDFSQSRYYPAIVSGPSDRWAPAEGGEVTIKEATLIHSSGRARQVDLSKMADDTVDRIYKMVEQGLGW